MTTEATLFVPPVTNEEAIEFLENACRNWAEFPVLSPPDIEDVAKSLTRFVRAAINRAEGHSLSQHCPNCEEQAAEIEKLRDRTQKLLSNIERLIDSRAFQAAEIEYWKTEARNVRKELKSEQKRADSAMDNYDAIHRRCEGQAAEIERLREALHTPLAFIEALHENDPDDQIADNGMTVLDGLKQQAPSVIKTIRAALGETK